MTQAPRRARKPALVSPPVLQLVPRPAAPARLCQDVADGVNVYRQEALHGCYDGALVAFFRPNGDMHWQAFGTLGNNDAETLTAASTLTNHVYLTCYRKGV